MSASLLALAFLQATVPAAPSELAPLGYDTIRNIRVAKPRTAPQFLYSTYPSYWVTQSEGYDKNHPAEQATGCSMLTDEGRHVICGGPNLWDAHKPVSLNQGIGVPNGRFFYIVTKLNPFRWIMATESQQKHMEAFQTGYYGADRVGRFGNEMRACAAKHPSCWIALAPYPNYSVARAQGKDTSTPYFKADRLLVALVRSDARGKHPNTEVTVPLGGSYVPYEMDARFDNLGRALVDVYLEHSPGKCEHRWYLVDFVKKKASELRDRRRTVPLFTYRGPNSAYETRYAPFDHDSASGRYLIRFSAPPVTREHDSQSRKTIDLPKVNDNWEKYQYWRGMLLRWMTTKMPNQGGNVLCKGAGLFLVSSDRRSQKPLGNFAVMCTSANGKHMLVRNYDDETVWLLSWNKAPGGS